MPPAPLAPAHLVRRRPAAARACTTGLALAGLIAGGTATPLEAQYFGQNRVRYDRHDTRVLATPHFDVHFDAPAEPTAREVGRKAERWVARLAPFFGGERALRGRRPIILYTNHPDFQQTRLLPEDPSEGTRAFAEANRNRIVMPILGTGHETDHVVGHEIVHLMQFDMAAGLPGDGRTALFSLPLWWVEGQAEYLSLGRGDALTAAWMRAALAADRLPTLQQLTVDPRFFPYRYGHAFWAFVAGRWGEAAVEPLFRAALTAGIDGAIRQVLGVTPDELTAMWHESIREAFAPIVAVRTGAGGVGTPVLRDGAAAMTLAPSLSPDGTWLAVLAPRAFFGMNLELVSMATGRVVRTLAGPAREPHADALSFLYAAGAWSPDSRRFAHIVSRRGDHELAIVDVATGARVRRVRLPGVQSISGVAWAPDGVTLAIAGTSHGQPDLWLHTLDTRITRRLTDDPYAELLPAWSPDGRMLAIATDNHAGTDLAALDFGPLRVALLDPASGRVRPSPGLDALDRAFPGVRTSNPQWSSDGRTLFVVADAGGVSDVFAVGVATGTVTPVTQLATGVYGITERSPALTVAAQAGTMVATVFDGRAYRAVRLGEPVRTVAFDAAAGVLPPHDAPEPSAVDVQLADPGAGLPGPFEGAPTTRRYRAQWGVEGVQTPGAGIAGGPFGATLGGGAGIAFGDLLGRQRLTTAIFAQGRIEDIGAQAVYQDMRSRWNWFASLGRTPVRGVTGGQSIETVVVGGRQQQAIVVTQAEQRVVINQASLGVQYPFSRRRRLEFALGGVHEQRDGVVRRDAFVGGVPVGRATDRLDPFSTTYGTASVALVHDDAIPGPVSPKSGGRWRLEAGQSVGEVRFGSALADLRRYLPLGPTVVALRGLHFGRYGGDAESRLAPIFIGDPTLVRGYRADTFLPSECGPGGGCPGLARLAGSRIAVASAELRLPVHMLLARGGGGILPGIEIAPFVDAGLAWNAGDPVRWALAEGTGRGIVTSGGVSMRFAAAGLRLELTWAQPWQREGRGGIWTFGFVPAW